jgi:hypothetical protein
MCGEPSHFWGNYHCWREVGNEDQRQKETKTSERHGNRQKDPNGDRQNNREVDRRYGQSLGNECVPVYTLRLTPSRAVTKDRADPSLETQGWVCEKACFVTIYTRE